MSAALLDLAIFTLLACLLMYGLNRWEALLAEPSPEEDDDPQRPRPDPLLALWLLIIGGGLLSGLGALLAWWQGD